MAKSESTEEVLSEEMQTIESRLSQEYKYGFVTDIDQETIPPGLDEEVVKTISLKKNEPDWLLEWRLKAYRQWLKMEEPDWSMVKYNEIDYQAISYYAAPKSQEDGPKSLDEVDPELLETYEKPVSYTHLRAHET